MRLRQSPSGPFVDLPSFPEEGARTAASAVTIDWSDGPAQELTLTGNVTATSIGLAADAPTWVQLKVIQGSGGAHTLTIAGALTPGGAGLTLSSAAGAEDLVSIYWDGASLFAQVAGLAYS